ncbi:hypothetical protein [Micromonospora eburnea]|uniref:Uncharacterized protein n=1 Tax=Micromonospora eburnea TaxID=227316 RepID=A0A1C6UV24_9ACTN|nr:hypothetical protein [Micromonospora eburnea]SCL57870.1 hypothetical protein GA0070604_3713 [Micromonospora eburnea]
MSKADNKTFTAGDDASTRTRGTNRLAPAAASFALGAALLAGVVVAPEAPATGLGTAAQELIGITDTGCCGGND